MMQHIIQLNFIERTKYKVGRQLRWKWNSTPDIMEYDINQVFFLFVVCILEWVGFNCSGTGATTEDIDFAFNVINNISDL